MAAERLLRDTTGTRRPHVFDRFWRAEKSRNRHTGGSGLSIARRFTEAHGGSLSAPGTETVFTLQPPG